MKYKNIIGGTEKEAEKKFPWLKDAVLKDAVIDISNNFFVWKGGVWECGTWKCGVWEGGVWKGGVWKGGVWEDGVWECGTWKCGTWKGGVWECGVWECGNMWDNLRQIFIAVKYDTKKKGFVEVIR